MKAEHQEGDTLYFLEGSQTLQGELVGVTPPGKTASGLSHPTEYWIDCDDGIPHCVYPAQVVERARGV